MTKQRDENHLEDSGETHAADEPTAVWDVEELRKAGLDEALARSESERSAPATRPIGVQRPSIIVEPELAPREASRQASPVTNPPRGRFGWLFLLGIAGALGAVAYAIIRGLR